MAELSQLVGNRIREFRKMQHLSQEELAEKCGMHRAHIGQLERGEKNASLISIQSICHGLQITMDELLYGIMPDDDATTGSSRVTDQVNQLLKGLDEADQLVIYHMLVEVLKLKS